MCQGTQKGADERMQKNVWQLTIPIFIESLMFSLMGSIDVVMLAKFSDDAVAAVSVANQVMFLIQVLACIVTTGSGILCAQYIGANKKPEDQNTLIAATVILNLGIGIVLTVVLILLHPVFLKLLNLEGAACGYAEEYLQIISLFIWGQMAMMAFSTILRAYGRALPCMLVSLGMNICNIVLNYLLIFGKFGCPAMGIRGAALATVMGRLTGLLIFGWMLYRMREKDSGWRMLPEDISEAAADEIHIREKWMKVIRGIRQRSRDVIAYGLPAAGEQISYNCSQFFVMVFITMLGTKMVTAYSYLNTCVSFIYMFSMALGQATAILTGWSVGAGDYRQADRQCRFSGTCSIVVSMSIMIFVSIFRYPVFSLFTANREILNIACTVLLVNFVREAGRSQNLIYVNALRAAGDVQFPFYFGLISMWGLSVGMSYILGISLGWGLTGVWLALGLDECFRAVGMYVRWKRKFGKLAGEIV